MDLENKEKEVALEAAKRIWKGLSESGGAKQEKIKLAVKYYFDDRQDGANFCYCPLCKVHNFNCGSDSLCPLAFNYVNCAGGNETKKGYVRAYRMWSLLLPRISMSGRRKIAAGKVLDELKTGRPWWYNNITKRWVRSIPEVMEC